MKWDFKDIEGKHIMKMEYPDGTIHSVDCYKFAKAVLEDGEEVYFIEYKDYDNKRDGKYTDSYCVVVNSNGKWQKSERKIDYSKLSSKVIENYDPKVLGNNLEFFRLDNSYTFNQLGISIEQQKLQPKTQTQSKKVKNSPIKNTSNQDYSFDVKEPEPTLKTQTEMVKQEIKHHHSSKKEKKEVFVCIPTDVTKKYVRVASLEDLFFRRAREGAVGLSYSGIKENVKLDIKDCEEIDKMFYHETQIESKNTDEIYLRRYDFASFNIVNLSNQFLSIFGKQILILIEQAKEKGINKATDIWNCFDETISFNDFQSIEIDDTIYRFVPCNRDGYYIPFNEYYTNIDIVVDQVNNKKQPTDILEGYFDYSIPMAKEFIDYCGGMDPTYKRETWSGYTKDVEIKKLKKECSHLKRLIASNQTQIETVNQKR